MDIKGAYFKPIFNENSVSYLFDDENNERFLISKKHPELDKLVLNKEGAFILKHCDGNNSISDISNKLNELYPNIEYSIIDTDVKNLIFTCWRLGIINWKEDNPYNDIFKTNINKLHAKLLFGDSIIKSLKAINEDCFRYDTLYIKSVAKDKDLIEQMTFYNVTQFFNVEIDNTSKMLFSLENSKICGQGIKLHIYIFDSPLTNFKDEINKIILWAINVYSKFTSKQFNRIDVFIEENDRFSEILNSLDFRLNSILKKHIYIEEKDEFKNLSFYNKFIR
ncbi:TPA: hypothetical protein ACF2C8_000008 [Clostridium perfringens]